MEKKLGYKPKILSIDKVAMDSAKDIQEVHLTNEPIGVSIGQEISVNFENKQWKGKVIGIQTDIKNNEVAISLKRKGHIPGHSKE